MQHELNDLQQAHLFGDENAEDRERLRRRIEELGARKKERLNIVTYCKGEQSRLRIIQDPISKRTPEMLHRQVQYFVEEEDWAREGREVETNCEAGKQRT